MKIAVIGAGKIGRAIAERLAKAKIGEVIATRRHLEEIRDLEEIGVKLSDNKSAASEADVIIISVKPEDVPPILKEIEHEIIGKLVISVAAAVSLSLLKKLAPKCKFIRCMPNLAVLVGESFTAYSVTEDVTEADERIAQSIFKALGVYARVDEKYMDVITALSGSIPAYASTFIEALAYGGIMMGLPRNLAIKSSAQALLGTAKLILETGKHPAEVRDMVITPGGVAIEGERVMEDGRIRAVIMNAIRAATEKSMRISRKMEEIVNKHCFLASTEKAQIK